MSELEDRSIENIQTIAQREKQMEGAGRNKRDVLYTSNKNKKH